jgi:hypothetical protein
MHWEETGILRQTGFQPKYQGLRMMSVVLGNTVAADSFYVVVINPKPTTAPASSHQVRVTPDPPMITSLNPASGRIGDTVTISGTGFGALLNDITVTFNGVAAAVTSWADTAIVATVPGGASTGDVLVTVSGVQSNAAPFTVIVPVITQLSSGYGSQGDTLTISGMGFGATQLTSSLHSFGSYAWPSASIISWSETSIVATVPVEMFSQVFNGGWPVTEDRVTDVYVAVGGVISNTIPFTARACINDPYTGLCWDTYASGYPWADAPGYCSSKGRRLPSIAEYVVFASQGTMTFVAPEAGVNSVYIFGSAQNIAPPLAARGYDFDINNAWGKYWSSTTAPDNSFGEPAAWAMFFTYSSFGSAPEYTAGGVRCVR